MDSSSSALHIAFSNELACLASFDGAWQDEWGHSVCSVFGFEVRWADGGSTTVTFDDEGVVKMVLVDGEEVRAHLDQDGTRLTWNDGETWHRSVSQAALLAIKSRSCGRQQLDSRDVVSVVRREMHTECDDDYGINLALALCNNQGFPEDVRRGFVRKIYGTVAAMLAIVCAITVPCWCFPEQTTQLMATYERTSSSMARHSLFVLAAELLIRLSLVENMPLFVVSSKEGSLLSMKTAWRSQTLLVANAIACGLLVVCGAARYEMTYTLAFAPTALLVVVLFFATLEMRRLEAYVAQWQQHVAVATALVILVGFSWSAQSFIILAAAIYGVGICRTIEHIGSGSMMALVLGRLEPVVDLSAIVAWDVFNGCLPYVCRRVQKGREVSR